MHILLLTQYFWPETFGINGLVSALRAEETDITVLTGQPNYPEGRIFDGYATLGMQSEEFSGADVLRVPLLARGKASGMRLALNYLSFILSAGLLGPWRLRGRRIDAVFVYAPSPLLQALPAILIAKLKRAPLAVWVQDLWPESLAATGFVRNKTILRLVEALVRVVYRHADLILIQSKEFLDPVARLTDDPRKIRYFPNAVESAEPPSASSPDVENLAQEIRRSFSVVFAGNLGTAQSVETILDAADALRAHEDIRFFLVGSGSRSEWLQEQITARGLHNVVLPGRFPPEAMPVLFGAAEVLLATLRDEPIFTYTIPSKLQAYLAAGRPIVASLNGEGARIIEEAKAGLSCPAEDSGALAVSILQIRNLAGEERTQLGVNGRRFLEERFNLSKLARELKGELTSLAANKKENR